jgi:hypothetical protein
MFMSRHQNAEQIQNRKTCNKSLEYVVKFEFSGKNSGYTDEEEVNSRLNSENACYQSVQNILSSRLLSKY